MIKDPAEIDAAYRRCGDRPGARQGAGVPAAGPHRGGGRRRYHRSQGRGPFGGGVRDRRLRAQRRRPAPRVLRPGTAGRRYRRRRHRRPGGAGVQLRLHLHLQSGPASSEIAEQYAALQEAQAAAVAAVRPGDRRAGRRGRPRCARRCRAGWCSSCTAPATASGSRCTRSPTSSRAMIWHWPRAWRFPSSPASTCRDAGAPDRGHRHRHRRRRAAGQQPAA